MANLGPQKINLSYDGLLQVPGGITASLQSVTDGNGNSTGLQISSTGFGGQITSDGVVITGGTINGTTIGATNAAAGRFTTLTATGTTTLATSLTGILKGTSGVVGLASAGTDYVSPSVLGAANGVATLGSDSKLTASQVPNIAIVEYLGTVNSQAAMLALTGQQGDWCIRSDLGTTWVITGSNPAVIGSWTQLSYPTAPVTSVNTQTGAVSLSYSDVGAAPATTGSSILYANGSGGFSNVTVGSGLSFAGGTLAASAASGTVTTVSVVSANGLAGTVANASSTPAITLSTTVSGLLKGDGTAISAATAGTDYQSAITATGILKGAGSGTVSSAVSGTDYAPGTSALATGILKSTTSTGALAIAVVGTDYAPATTGTSILKGNGSGGFSNATSGTDYAPATSGTSLLKGNGSGGFSNATSGTDYAPATSGTSILYGSGSGGFSNVTVGSGLSFVGGTLASTSGGGSVTTVSVVSANGFAGTVSNPSSTPAITLTTSVTGLLKGNGTAISAATSGTDYAPATSGTSILKGNGAGGFSSAAAGTDYLAPPSGTAIIKANSGGALANAVSGTDYTSPTGTENLSNKTITASSLNSTPIGASSAAAGTFTTATANSFIPNSSTVPTNGFYYPATNVVGWATNSAERMRLDSSGNLGLGVTPSGWATVTALQVKNAHFGGYSDQAYFGANAYYSGGWKYISTARATRVEQYNGEHQWYTSPSGTAGNAISFTQAMTLDANGYLLLGATSVGLQNNNSIQLAAGAGYGIYSHINGTASATAYLYFSYNGTSIGSITQNGTTGVLYNIVSDRRLKTDKGIATDTSVIDNTVVHDFEWKVNGSIDRGVFAQEAHKVKPSAVTEGTDELNEDGTPVHPWGVDYSKYVPDLIVYCQQLRAELNELKAKVNA